MANSRLYIVCKKCEDYFLLAKYYPVGGFIAGDIGWGFLDQVDERDKWIQKHEKHAKDLDINFGNYFVFVTEIDDDKVEFYDFVKHKIRLKA